MVLFNKGLVKLCIICIIGQAVGQYTAVSSTVCVKRGTAASFAISNYNASRTHRRVLNALLCIRTRMYASKHARRC